MKATVIYGSVRSARQGIRAARFVKQQVADRGHTVTLVDPLELALPMLDLRYREYHESEAPPAMRELAAAIKDSDALVFVTAEYNHGIPPAMKNIIDHFGSEFPWRVAGIASYSAGGFGGLRAALQLRTTLSAVGLCVIPKMFPMSHVDKSFSQLGEAVDKVYEDRISGFLDELEWYADALAAARARGIPGQ